MYGLLLPAMLTFSLDPLLGAVDTAIVGRLGATALGAVGISNMAMNFSMMVFRFLMVVTTPAVAGAAAKKQWDKVSRATSDGLWVAWCCGIPAGLALWTFAPSILASLKAGPELIAPATDYLRARAWAAPVATSLFVLQATFRGLKDTRTPLVSSLISNAVNLSGDLLFVFVVGLGVAGAAWATTGSQYVAAAFLAASLISRRALKAGDVLRPPSWAQVAPLVKAGVLLTSQSLISTFLLLQSAVYAARMGHISMAAHEVARQVFIIQYIVFAALELTSQTLVASALGKDDAAEATSALRRVMGLALRFGLGMAATLLVGSLVLPQLFTNDAEVIALARQLIPVIALGSPLDALAATMDGGLQGATDYKWVSVQMTLGSAVSWAAIQLILNAGGGLVGVWAGLRMIAVVRVSGALYRLYSGKARITLAGKGDKDGEGEAQVAAVAGQNGAGPVPAPAQ